MLSTIDRAGRVVIPKSIRDALGLTANTEIEITLDDGSITIVRRPVEKRLRVTDRGPEIVVDDDVPPLTVAAVRSTLESVRR